jgi:hypothetical protein
VLADITGPGLEGTAVLVRELGRAATIVTTDVTGRTAVERLARTALYASSRRRW